MQNNKAIRYSRHYTLPGFGKEKQHLLEKSKVLVVGAGGLGCPVLQYLTAAGIGTLGIVDGDKVELSNLQRQVLFNVDDIGQFKAEVAAKKMKMLNPEVDFKVYRKFLNHENALEIVRQYDLVVDGTDNFNSRYLINDAAVILEKPVVFGSILGFEGQVSVFNWGKEGPTYRCVFPEAPDPLNSPSCSELGVIGVLPGMIGSFQANEVIKICTGIGQPLSGKLLIYNALTSSQLMLSVSKNPENKKINKLSTSDFSCSSSVQGHEISMEEFLQKEDFWKEKIVDVRSENEFRKFNKGGINLPLQNLAIDFKELSLKEEILLVCQSGQRSQHGIFNGQGV